MDPLDPAPDIWWPYPRFSPPGSPRAITDAQVGQQLAREEWHTPFALPANPSLPIRGAAQMTIMSLVPPQSPSELPAPEVAPPSPGPAPDEENEKGQKPRKLSKRERLKAQRKKNTNAPTENSKENISPHHSNPIASKTAPSDGQGKEAGMQARATRGYWVPPHLRGLVPEAPVEDMGQPQSPSSDHAGLPSTSVEPQPYQWPHERLVPIETTTSKPSEGAPVSQTKTAVPRRDETFGSPPAPYAKPQPVNKARETPTVARGRGRSRWATKAEVRPPKGPPPAVLSDDGSLGNGSWPSNEAVRSNDGNGLRLWDGGWAPAPIEWESRPDWKDRHLKEHLIAWLESVRASGGTTPGKPAVDVTLRDFYSGRATVNGYQLVASPAQEEILPNPEKCEKLGQTSNTAMLMKRIRVLERQVLKKDRLLAEAIHRSHSPTDFPVCYENPHAPKADIYLRHAVVTDLNACREIYNHYAAVSVIVPDRNPLTEEQVRYHYDDVRHVRLPWIVAVERPKDATGSGPDGKGKIVGYAFADDYGDPADAYRFTVEMSLFAHPDHVREGVGKTLLDKLVSYLDPLYIARGGYDFEDNDDFWGPGGQRVISKVLCNIPYTKDDSSEMEWLKKWLAEFEFEEMGTLKEVGRKFDKWQVGRGVRTGNPHVTHDANMARWGRVNVLYLQKTTGSDITTIAN